MVVAPAVPGAAVGGTGCYLERPRGIPTRLAGIRRGWWKFLMGEGGEEELYDLDGDPGEVTNLVSAMPGRADSLREELSRWIASDREARPPVLDDESREKLRALGYLED